MEINKDDFDIQLITHKQLQPIIDNTKQLIDSLPDRALNQLLGAYEDDVNGLLNEIMLQTHYVFHHNASKIDSERLGYYSWLENVGVGKHASTIPLEFVPLSKRKR